MKVYIGLGANIGNRAAAIREAVNALERRIGPLVACSSLRETMPVGFASPHLFLNAAACFETHLEAEELLRVTQETERQLGRTEKTRNGAYSDRRIDIDLLCLEDHVCNTPQLQLPHPRAAERRFVMEPLAEIAPDLRLCPDGATVRELLDRLNTLRIALVTKESLADAAAALGTLLPQLTANATPPQADDLKKITATGHTYIYIGYDEAGQACASATLCVCASPTGEKGWIEDVVVNAAHRQRGYGAALIRHLQAESRRLGLKSLNLTSQPTREAANRLYRRMGFLQRETNVYRWPCFPCTEADKT